MNKRFFLGAVVMFILLASLVYLFREALFWKTYRNEELGFSFRYPASWYVSGKFPTGTKNEVVIIYIDKQEKVPVIGQDVSQSQGGTSLWIDRTKMIYDAWVQQGLTLTETRFGDEVGYVWENDARTTTGTLLLSKDVIFERESEYHIETITYAVGKSFFAELIARYYHWIGMMIIDSIRFEK